jgi:hypothetical protein
MKKVNQLFKDAPLIGWLLLGGICWALFQFLRAGKAAVTAVSSTKAANAVKNAVTAQTGVSPEVFDICGEVAQKVYDAIYNYMFGMQEDEATVIANLNKLSSASQARATAAIYAAMPKGRSLKDDILKYLSSSQQKEIKAAVRSAI